jgi:HAD superfamily phosphoserine phosphatase-like hydrolase
MFYKIIFLDLDGVLVEKPRSESRSDKVAVSTWDVLFQELGIYDTHEKLKQEFESGILSSYMAWTEAACNVLKSIRLNQNTFLDVINRRPIAQGAAELLRELRKNKVKVAIATGSFDALAQRIQNELGPIDYSLAHCKLLFNEKGFLNDWKLQSVDYEDKADFVERVAKKEKVPLNRCAYVGDDVNDLIAFEKVGLAVAFNSKKVKVRQSANLVIDSRDLRAILPHLYVPSARGEIS